MALLDGARSCIGHRRMAVASARGRVVIVTGAGRGIGRGEAIELAREGARVVVNELDPEVGQAVVDEITAAGGEAVLDTGDCSEESTRAGLVADARSTPGAGSTRWSTTPGILRDRTVAKMSADEWDAVIKVHLRGHFLPTHFACAHWKEAGTGGRIVCTASTSGMLGNFGQANYGAAKAGIAAFSTIVAMEMARYGVRCNAIAPAARTRMTESAYGAFKDLSADDEGETFDFWHPDNVAPLVAYLCSDVGRHDQRQGLRRAGRRGRALPAVHVGRGDPEPRHPVDPRGHRGPGARAVRGQRHQPRGREHDGQAALHDDRARRRSSQSGSVTRSYVASPASSRHTPAPTRRIVPSRTWRSRVRPMTAGQPGHRHQGEPGAGEHADRVLVARRQPRGQQLRQVAPLGEEEHAEAGRHHPQAVHVARSPCRPNSSSASASSSSAALGARARGRPRRPGTAPPTPPTTTGSGSRDSRPPAVTATRHCTRKASGDADPDQQRPVAGRQHQRRDERLVRQLDREDQGERRRHDREVHHVS